MTDEYFDVFFYTTWDAIDIELAVYDLIREMEVK